MEISDRRATEKGGASYGLFSANRTQGSLN